MRTTPPALLLVLGLVLGCAHPNHTRIADGLDSRGPGSVHPTIEAAAVDALILAHQQGRSDGLVRRVRAGSIQRADGGYTYRQLLVAPRRDPHRVRLDLGPEDVAHFRAYTRDMQTHETLIVNHVRERPSRSLRLFVDRHDPLHRPVFILTPSLQVRVYRGLEEGLFDVADLRTQRRDGRVAGRSVSVR